jgi:small subunit ribosomal protein S16
LSVHLRLFRMGAKKKPFYRIVAVDSRQARGGSYIESVGTYNPLQDPAEVNLKEDRIVEWLKCGAQPTQTVRNLIKRFESLKDHLH